MAKQTAMAKRSIAICRTQPANGSLTSIEHYLRDPLAESVDRAMDLSELRREYVSHLKGEIAGGRYNVGSSELAACLLRIARRDFH